MLTLQGRGVSGGVTIGRASILRREPIRVTRQAVADSRGELLRYGLALRETVTELEELYDWAVGELGQGNAQIFSVHAMIAQDEDFAESVRDRITAQKINAEYAVFDAAEQYASVFSRMDDPYMRERAADVHDVADRILRHLTEGKTTRAASAVPGKEGVILCADDLSPSETVRLDKRQIRAIVTARGSSNSHTAILSRTMNLPAVVSVGEALSRIADGTLIAVDADAGRVFVDPDEETLSAIRSRMEQRAHERELLQKYRGRESRTPDGHRVEICANIGGVSDLSAVLENDADGIGLFRSEFLYLGRNDFPTEDEQYLAYSRVLRGMAGKRVIVRTLDIGADKKADYFGLAPEENPALGCRAIRISLSRPEIFLTQARALLRASYDGHLAVMFPMVISTEEVVRLKALWKQAEDDLRRRGIPFAGHIDLGIMVETPAAALISDKLAPMVDFFSIGTNDLTQYTLALDRQNPALDEFCDTHHEAVLRLIRTTVENAHRAGIWVGICGELAADRTLTEEFLRLGVDELSVTPPAILPLREKVCTTRLSSPPLSSRR